MYQICQKDKLRSKISEGALFLVLCAEKKSCMKRKMCNGQKLYYRNRFHVHTRTQFVTVLLAWHGIKILFFCSQNSLIRSFNIITEAVQES